VPAPAKGRHLLYCAPVTFLQFLLATGVVTVGATLQGSLGYGLGIFSVPFLLLIEPELIPGPLLSSSIVLTILVARRHWEAVRLGDLRWAVLGRLVGVGLALLALLTAPPDWLGPGFGVVILLGVALSASGVKVSPAPTSLSVAGLLSGFMGTLVSVGGPPMALLYQRESGPRMRGTLSAYFVVGVVISTAGLVLIGKYGLRELALAVALVPGLLIGFTISRTTLRLLDRGYARVGVVVISAIAAVVVIVRG